MAAMQHQDASSSSVHRPPQADAAILRDHHSVVPDAIQSVRAIISPKRAAEEPLQLQTPPPPRSCSSPGPGGKSCWSLDLRVAVLLVTLAGAVILLLLYKLLQLRHRLQLARARHALEYSGFYHSATYRLLQPTACPDPPTKNGAVPEAPPPVQTLTAPPAPPAPTLPLPPTPPVLRPPSAPPTPRVLSLPLPPPAIHTTPPSPHLSWAACSEADVYSRIGAFRPSRLSSQSTVILFEHSAL
ncbi:amyloid beta A4 precursor protein-binding family B member 1-interacting protein [Kryptolebias marmoratus]|uniref:amyloid beta A4 precursor protein-binding family B member 1-interacting protein n=1 Tax=Kryptolebias marmoratus TaxID=37003 RepID=UPI0007F90AE3|nr:amyloid beta A4 precursor protein-binding family B member 1-interacting protein [Kryptolebias marmoratus]